MYVLNVLDAKRLPVKLAYACEFERITEAIAAERQIKNWSKAKKKALIDGNYDLLSNLAKKKWNK
jgi:putative endonuclease